MSVYPWEVNEGNLNNFFKGPHLFAALYRVYRGAYFGQGFQFVDTPSVWDRGIHNHFDKLPLEIKRLIFSKIWDQGRGYNILIVKKGILFLTRNLHFLFAQYGRLKDKSQYMISRGVGAWNGFKLQDRTYIFHYGLQNLKSQVMIPDFISKDPYRPETIAFGLLCL